MKDELIKNVRLVKLQIFPAAKKRQKASFHLSYRHNSKSETAST